MACVLAYVGIVKAFNLGDPWHIIGTAQFCVFVPLAVVFVVLVYKTRELRVGQVKRQSYKQELAEARERLMSKAEIAGVKRTACVKSRGGGRGEKVKVEGQGQESKKVKSKSENVNHSLLTNQPTNYQLPTTNSSPLFATSEQAWEQACRMPHGSPPDPRRDRDYIALVYYAADGGHAAALKTLAEIAFARKKNVEAFFWASVSKKCGQVEGVDMLLRQIRRAWQVGGMRREHKNVTAHFTEDRGKIGRALIRIACGVKVTESRLRLRKLSKDGDPDAALFA